MSLKKVPVKAVIFDLGGVITPDLWENAVDDEEHGIRALHPELTREQCFAACESLWREFGYKKATPGVDGHREWWTQFILRNSGSFTTNANPDEFITMADYFIRPIDGAIPLLEELRARGVPMAACSNNTPFWSRLQFDKLGLHRFFGPHATILSCDVGASKSSPRFEMFNAAVDALRVSSDSCAFVDDRESNLLRAREFGIHTVLCVGGYIDGVRGALAALGVLS